METIITWIPAPSALFTSFMFLREWRAAGSDLAAHGQNFLDLAFALTGGAGLSIVATMMWSYFRGLPLGDVEEEQRRIAAHDL